MQNITIFNGKYFLFFKFLQTGMIESWNIVKVQKVLKELETAFDKTRSFNDFLKKFSSEYFNTFYESRRTFELF